MSSAANRSKRIGPVGRNEVDSMTGDARVGEHRFARRNDVAEVLLIRKDRHTCGVVSRQVMWWLLTWWSGPSARSGGACRSTSSMSPTSWWRTWLVRACRACDHSGWHGGIWLRSSFGEVGQPAVSGAGAYLRHARSRGDMKPCGHDHDELNHVGSISTVGVVMPFASCVVAVPDITLSGRRGNGSRRRAARSRRA